MDPATLLTAFKVVGGVSSAIGASAKGQSEANNLEAEARLADTQALQRDTNSRDELNRFLGSVKSSRAGSNLSSLSPNALNIINEANRTSNKERLIDTANYKQRAANLRSGARNKRRGARFSLFTGAISAGVPLIQSQI